MLFEGMEKTMWWRTHTYSCNNQYIYIYISYMHMQYFVCWLCLFFKIIQRTLILLLKLRFSCWAKFNPSTPHHPPSTQHHLPPLSITRLKVWTVVFKFTSIKTHALYSDIQWPQWPKLCFVPEYCSFIHNVYHVGMLSSVHSAKPSVVHHDVSKSIKVKMRPHKLCDILTVLLMASSFSRFRLPFLQQLSQSIKLIYGEWHLLA